MPLPPPPATAFSKMGKPIDCARAWAWSGFSMGSLVPGTVGTSERRASWRPAVFDPSASIACAVGPMKVMPAAVQARGSAAFSARKP